MSVDEINQSVLYESPDLTSGLCPCLEQLGVNKTLEGYLQVLVSS